MLTVNGIAELIEQECAHWAEPSEGDRALSLARDILAALIGKTDDEPGLLDRYEIGAYQGPQHPMGVLVLPSHSPQR
jgi:hypothetical protein